MNISKIYLYATIAMLLWAVPLSAQVIIDYQASGDPISQGWEESPDGGFPTVGAGTDTLDHWFVDDNSNAAGAYVPSDLTDCNMEQPWQIESVMRLASGSGPAGMGFGAQAIDQDRYFRLDLATDGVYFQANRNNDVTPYFDATAAAFDTSAYHRYELTVHATAGKPPTDQVTLHIDGQLVADLTRDDIRGLGAGPTMNFGSGSSGGKGELRYNFVQLTHDTSILGVAPKPPTLNYNWNVASGDWNVTGNWTPSDGPPGQGTFHSQHNVIFGDSIGSDTRTVFTDDPITINRISFANTLDGSYRIAGGPSINLTSSTLDPSVFPSITVAQGSHRFQAPVFLHNDTSVDVATNSTLIFDGPLDLMGNTISKTGVGEVAIRNDLLTGGGSLDVQEGTLSGNGTVGGNVHNDGGVISPGNRSLSTTGVPEPSTFLLGMSVTLLLLASRLRHSVVS